MIAQAGYCKECNRNVWLNEDGNCENGHNASSIVSVYDTEMEEEEIKAADHNQERNVPPDGANT